MKALPAPALPTHVQAAHDAHASSNSPKSAKNASAQKSVTTPKSSSSSSTSPAEKLRLSPSPSSHQLSPHKIAHHKQRKAGKRKQLARSRSQPHSLKALNHAPGARPSNGNPAEPQAANEHKGVSASLASSPLRSSGVGKRRGKKTVPHSTGKLGARARRRPHFAHTLPLRPGRRSGGSRRARGTPKQHRKRRPQRKQHVPVPLSALSMEQKEIIIEELASEQNAYLLMILEKEQQTEHDREAIMRATTNNEQRARYEETFNMERAQAREIIKAITREHETTLALKMQELGML